MFRVMVGVMVIFFLLGVSAASADTLWVDDDPGCGGNSPCYSSVQEAVDASGDGDTIVVRDGTYQENVVVDNQLALKSENGSANCIIDAGGSGSPITLIADGITVERFTTTNSSDDWGDAGIKVVSTNNTIINNNISYNWKGIDLSYSSNNTINNNNISSNTYSGIDLSYSSNNTITCNNVSNNHIGIEMWGSSNNTINNTIFINNGIVIGGSLIGHWNTHVIEDNIVNNKPLYYFKNQVGVKVPEDAGQVILGNCTGMRVENLNISNTDFGFQLGFSSQSNIKNNNLTKNNLGIRLDESRDNTITCNMLSNSGCGVSLWDASNNTINNNSISSNTGNGISVFFDSSNNTINNNNISSNTYHGIRLDDSSNNTINNNDIYSNNRSGIYLDGSSNNTINNNTASNNYDGVCLIRHSGNNVVSNNSVSNNYKGFNLSYSSNNVIADNRVSYNYYHGMCLESSHYNDIFDNNINGNRDDGVTFSQSRGNNLLSNQIHNSNKGITLDGENPQIEDIRFSSRHYHHSNGILVGATETLRFDNEGGSGTVKFEASAYGYIYSNTDNETFYIEHGRYKLDIYVSLLSDESYGGGTLNVSSPNATSSYETSFSTAPTDVAIRDLVPLEAHTLSGNNITSNQVYIGSLFSKFLIKFKTLQKPI